MNPKRPRESTYVIYGHVSFTSLYGAQVSPVNSCASRKSSCDQPWRLAARFKACPEFVERVQKFKAQCFQTKLIPILLKELASTGRLHVLRILKTSKRSPFDIPALDSSRSPQAVDIETISPRLSSPLCIS